MPFQAIVYSVDEQRPVTVNLQEKRNSSSESAETVSLSNTLDEDHLETIMQDAALDYVMLATVLPDESFCQVPEDGVEETTIEEDFVLISEDVPSATSSSAWRTLQQYASATAKQGGAWTNKLMDATLNMVQPRKFDIHSSYDWVSDTDVQGGRLILPGQLISWDDTSDLHLERQGAPLLSMRQKHSSSMVMVLAYDLLACQTADVHDWELTSGTTLSIPLMLVKIAKRKSSEMTKLISKRLEVSTLMMKRQVGNVLSPPLASAAGLIHHGLEWLFPPQIGARSTDLHSYTSRTTQNIELSIVLDMKHRLTVKEHTLR